MDENIYELIQNGFASASQAEKAYLLVMNCHDAIRIEGKFIRTGSIASALGCSERQATAAAKAIRFQYKDNLKLLKQHCEEGAEFDADMPILPTAEILASIIKSKSRTDTLAPNLQKPSMEVVSILPK